MSYIREMVFELRVCRVQGGEGVLGGTGTKLGEGSIQGKENSIPNREWPQKAWSCLDC